MLHHGPTLTSYVEQVAAFLSTAERVKVGYKVTSVCVCEHYLRVSASLFILEDRNKLICGCVDVWVCGRRAGEVSVFARRHSFYVRFNTSYICANVCVCVCVSFAH